MLHNMGMNCFMEDTLQPEEKNIRNMKCETNS